MSDRRNPLSSLLAWILGQKSGEPGASFDTVEMDFRFLNYSILLLLGLPTMVVTGFYHFSSGNLLLFLLILILGAGLVAGWLRLRTSRGTLTVYRLNGLLYAVLLLYVLVVGGAGGSKSLWLFTFPLISHFLLGKIEGLAWNGAVYLSMLGLLYLPPANSPVYPYPDAFKLRLLVSYLVISVFSFWFEYLVSRYRRGMQQENRKLQDEHLKLREALTQVEQAQEEKEQVIARLRLALEEVKTLRGLLPICSYCHKIRNDAGAWNHLETYLQEHSEVKFTHGICPDCVTAHFPEMGSKKDAPKKES